MPPAVRSARGVLCGLGLDCGGVLSRGIPHGCRGSFLSVGFVDCRWLAALFVEGLGSSCPVDGELSDEVAVDEDVAGVAGGDGECLLSVVFGSNGDEVVDANGAAPVVDVVDGNQGWYAKRGG